VEGSSRRCSDRLNVEPRRLAVCRAAHRLPFPIGGARIFRVPPQGGEPEVYLDGFTNIIDIAFDASGNLYAVEIASGLQPPGQLIRVAPDGTRTTLVGGLVFPGGVAIGPDGAAYVTNFGIFPGGGQVLRVHE
jgi:glucose/arabinose dehydrogenase